jgi:hypothetical protein
LIKALTTLYPEHQFKPWLFRRVPQGYWNDPQNQLLFMDWFASVYNIKSVEDWYNVDVKEVVKNGGGGLIDKHNHSLIHALKSVSNITLSALLTYFRSILKSHGNCGVSTKLHKAFGQKKKMSKSFYKLRLRLLASIGLTTGLTSRLRIHDILYY